APLPHDLQVDLQLVVEGDISRVCGLSTSGLRRLPGEMNHLALPVYVGPLLGDRLGLPSSSQEDQAQVIAERLGRPCVLHLQVPPPLSTLGHKFGDVFWG